FFQAEDGIRVFHVTGVQTCALPISDRARREPHRRWRGPRAVGVARHHPGPEGRHRKPDPHPGTLPGSAGNAARPERIPARPRRGAPMSRRPVRRPTLRRSLVASGLLAGLAAGCTLLPANSRTYYELRDLAARPPAAPRARHGRPGPVLLVAAHPSSALYESSGIVYSRGDAGHAYYQYASWTERPSRQAALLAQRRLAASAAAGRLAIADAAMDTSGVRGDWLLGLRLVD